MAIVARKSMKRRDMDMTQGSMAKNIIMFAIPLFAGNLFQQLYNMVDTWVIGQEYGSTDGAYAAVGSVGPIINILLGFFMGLASGAGVIISQYYGAKDDKKVSETVHTAIKLTIIMSVAFTIIGVLMTGPILELMLGKESEVLQHAKKYLFIYFAGVSGMMFYNIGAGILRAVGDSRRPFYFLAIAAVINTVLDLVFVRTDLNMGVAGVALATVIAQFVSAILTMYVLFKTDSCVKIELKKLKIEKTALKKIFFVGFPAALQMAITAFSNVFVQSYISGVDISRYVTLSPSVDTSKLALGAWTSYAKIDQFIFLPVQSISLAITTFVGQNLGNNDIKRARKGTWLGFGMSVASAVFFIAVIEIFTPFFASIFNSDPSTVALATKLLRYLTPFYVLCSVNQVFAASMRGAGNTRIPMIVMLCSFVGFRQVYLYIMSNYASKDMLNIAMSYPAGWLVCAICMFTAYCLCDYSKSRLVED